MYVCIHRHIYQNHIEPYIICICVLEALCKHGQHTCICIRKAVIRTKSLIIIGEIYRIFCFVFVPQISCSIESSNFIVTAARFLGLFFIIFTDFALKNTLKLKLNQFCFYRLKIHHITGPLAYQTSTSFTVIVFFRIFGFGPLNFSHFAPNIHLFCRVCCQKHPKIENTSFFIL